MERDTFNRVGSVGFAVLCVAVEQFTRSLGFPESHIALRILYWVFITVTAVYGGCILATFGLVHCHA